MPKDLRLARFVAFPLFMAFVHPLNAAIITDPAIPAGQTLTINSSDTLVFNYGSILGNIENRGLFRADGDFYIGGALNNYGNLYSNNAFSILGVAGNGANARIINHSGANITMGGYIDMYSYSALFENAGRVSVVRGLGDGVGAYEPFTYLFRGTIKNTGVFLFDRNIGGNVCYQYSVGTIINQGQFEVADGTTCNFAEVPESSTAIASYVQNAGELKANGVFGAHKVRINAGTLSGKGTIIGFEDWPLFGGVTISPGAPVGTLTLTPNANPGYIVCVRCGTDIELAGGSNHDRIQVNGDLYLNAWRLNVALRNGYTPAAGTTFNIVTANSVTFYGPPPSYTLPPLPSGRSWSVENNGTGIVLRVN